MDSGSAESGPDAPPLENDEGEPIVLIRPLEIPMQQQDQPQQLEQEPAAEAAPGAAESEAGDRPVGLEEMLRQAELKAAEHHDAWLRAKAEAENARKRAQIDISNAHKYAIETFAGELLPVKDALEAALATDNASPQAIREGVELTLKQLASVFGKLQISESNPVGEKFDPHRHQAIGMVEADQASNTIVSVLQKGYLLHDRVLRPALVMVSKGQQA
jgi:molecular chaperone GrpE